MTDKKIYAVDSPIGRLCSQIRQEGENFTFRELVIEDKDKGIKLVGHNGYVGLGYGSDKGMVKMIFRTPDEITIKGSAEFRERSNGLLDVLEKHYGEATLRRNNVVPNLEYNISSEGRVLDIIRMEIYPLTFLFQKPQKHEFVS